MTSLLDLQRLFARVLRGAEQGNGRGSEQEMLLIDPGRDDFSPTERLSIYRNHHRLSLSAALQTHYPTVLAVIGADAFAHLAGDYVDRHPPLDARLAFYGADFVDFLGDDPRLRALPYLADVARFDWALIAAQIAAENRPFQVDDLAALGDGLAETRFGLHPATRIVRSPYPLLAIRNLALAGLQDEAPVDLAAGGCDLLIWRQGDNIIWRPMDRSALNFVTALTAGLPLGEALADMAGSALSAMIAGYLVSGAFCRAT